MVIHEGIDGQVDVISVWHLIENGNRKVYNGTCIW